MKRRLRLVFNVIFPWRELVRLKSALSRFVHESEVQQIEIDRLTSMVRELEDRNERLVETTHESSRQLRVQAQKINDLTQRANEMSDQVSAALNKLNTALMQVANFQAFMRGVKIPIFPGVGPDLPEAKPVDYEKLARQMPRSARQAEALAKQDFLKSFSTYLEEEAAQAEESRARTE